jgi:mono/diheme cytochrome c family protein
LSPAQRQLLAAPREPTVAAQPAAPPSSESDTTASAALPAAPAPEVEPRGQPPGGDQSAQPPAARSGARDPESFVKGGKSEQGVPPATGGDEHAGAEEVRDGRFLYERNCAGCHGLTGKGDGETAKQLGVTARDFAAGGFAFGNTRAALFRTVSGGLPGRSVMPAFAGTLSEQERWLVVDYVRTLMPPAEPESDAGSELVPGAGCVMARGKLPPAAEGARETVRGLLLGFPEGLTLEYAVDDVRLIAARMGAFAKRQDWVDRGGDYLRPLGTLVHHYAAGGSAPMVLMHPSPDSVALRARLRESWASGKRAGLAYDLLDAKGGRLAHVREELGVLASTAGTAVERRLEVEATSGALSLDFQAARALPDSGWSALEFSARTKAAFPIGGAWVPTAGGECAVLLLAGADGVEVSSDGVARARLSCSASGKQQLRIVLVPSAGQDLVAAARAAEEVAR